MAPLDGANRIPNVFTCFYVADNGVLSNPEHLPSPVLAVPPQIWA
jgi:hypothetical protein